MKKYIKPICITILIVISLVIGLSRLIGRVSKLAPWTEYTRNETIRETLFLVGLIIFLLATVLVGISVWKKGIFRRFGYLAIILYGIQMLLTQVIDVYDGYRYFGWDLFIYVAYLAIPVAGVLLFLSAKKCTLVYLIAIVACIVVMTIMWGYTAFNVPIMLAGLVLNMTYLKRKA